MGGFEPGSPTVRTADHSQLVISGSPDAGKVLTATGPRAASWADAGGGGGFGGASVASPSSCLQTAITGGQRLTFDGWAATAYKAGQPWPAIMGHPEQSLFGFATAGWYRLTCYVSLGFDLTGSVTPDHFSVQFSDYNQVTGFAHDVVCTAAPGVAGQSVQSRSLWGATAVLPSFAFYQEEDAVTGNFGIQPIIYFPGDATAANAGGGSVTAGGFKIYVEHLG